MEDFIKIEHDSMSSDELLSRNKLLESEIRIMRSEILRLQHEASSMKESINDNLSKIKLNKTLPYLVANVMEVLDLDLKDDLNQSGNEKRSAVIKTSTRTTAFLPLAGLVDPTTLKPGDPIGVNKDSFLILENLPQEYDSRVKAMEVDEKPTEDYNDIGGLDRQIEELVEAIVLPMTHPDKFKNLGIRPPKGKEYRPIIIL